MSLPQSKPGGAASALPPAVKEFAIWSAVLTALMFAVKVVSVFVLHLTGPYRWIVFSWDMIFVDFKCFYLRFQDFHRVTFFARDTAHSLVLMYPAPAALIYEPFYLFAHPVALFLLVVSGLVIIIAVQLRNKFVSRGLVRRSSTLLITIALLCSYPLYVEFFLANIEIAVVFIVAAGIYFFLSEKPYLAAACFGWAGATKLFPFIFFALLLQRRQYRQIALGLTVAAGLTVFSLWAVSSDVPVSWHGINGGLDYFRTFYVLAPMKHDIGIDHSLFGLYKGALILLDRPWPPLGSLNSVLRLYLAGTAVIGILLYILRIRLLPVLNQVLVLTIIGILFTAASHDYTLLHLYAPWTMMVLLAIEAQRSGYGVPGLRSMFLCMAFLLSPLSEFVAHDLLFGAQIKSVLLVVLLGLTLRFPLAARGATESVRELSSP
jgi:hypothetical protein